MWYLSWRGRWKPKDSVMKDKHQTAFEGGKPLIPSLVIFSPLATNLVLVWSMIAHQVLFLSCIFLLLVHTNGPEKQHHDPSGKLLQNGETGCFTVLTSAVTKCAHRNIRVTEQENKWLVINKEKKSGKGVLLSGKEGLAAAKNKKYIYHWRVPPSIENLRVLFSWSSRTTVHSPLVCWTHLCYHPYKYCF